ncbi:unnamed protein product [Arabis nemorensis]|uniref:Uncharacterized protein n=1 Tax=Arabis nemorensis TaxID=586526 RepID=A0A565AVG4_9BRAS|nr:unnamed protein product [Arabis nemorensis]
MEMETKPLTGTHPDESQVTAEEFGDRQSVLDSPISSREELEITLFAEDNSQEMGNGVSEKLGNSLGGYDEVETVTSVRKDDQDKETVTSSTKTDCYIERENLSYEPGNPDCLVHELENPNVTTGCGSSRLINEGEPGVDDDLKSVLAFQPTTCSVDFQTPILDVKFNPEKKSLREQVFLRGTSHRRI